MKKYMVAAGILVLIGIVFLPAGCVLNQKEEAEEGLLVLNISNGTFGVETIEPDPAVYPMVIATYDIHGVGPYGKTFDITGWTETTAVQQFLCVGPWTILVDAYNSNVARIGSGVTTEPVMVTTQEAAVAQVTIKPLAAPGTLSLGISWPDSVVLDPDVMGTLGSIGSIFVDETFSGLGSGDIASTSYSAVSIAAGYYPLIIQLWDRDPDVDKVMWGAFEAVRIVSTFPTVGNFELTIDDINPSEVELAFDITPDLQNPITITMSGVPESGVLSLGSSMTVDTVLDPPDDPDDLQYTYHWYLNGELISGADESSLALTAGDAPVDVEGNYRLDFVVFYGGTISSENVQFSVAPPAWKAVGTAGFSDAESDYVSLFVDTGTPYVAYKDLLFSFPYKASVMKFDGTDWVYVGIRHFSADQADYTSLYVDNGTPYIAYKDAGNADKATVMKYPGATGWEDVGIAGFSEGVVSHTSLYVDSGIPYVAYSDSIAFPPNEVMKYPGATGWEAVGTAGFPAAGADYTSLFISGTPYVAYKDNSTSPAGKATVMKFNGTIWEAVGGTAGISDGVIEFTSLFVYNGTPYVAYKDNSTSPAGKATVMKYTVATGWEAVGPAGFSDGEVWHTSLAVYDGTPYVAYRDGANSDKATVMKFNGIIWEPVGGAAGISEGTVDFTSLFVFNGTPYVAYKDVANDGRVSVMKFN